MEESLCAKCMLYPSTSATKNQHSVEGEVVFIAERKGGDRLLIRGGVINLTPGPHGFHIHAGKVDKGQGKKDCDKACAHLEFSKTHNRKGIGSIHGGRFSFYRHAGDLGNIYADDQGTALINMIVFGITLDDIIGRTLIVHEGGDDLGKGQNNESKKTGNSGKRVACGLIEDAPCEEDAEFEIPDPLNETYGTSYSVRDILQLMYTASKILTKQGMKREKYHEKDQPIHATLAKMFDAFRNAKDEESMHNIDTLRIVPFLMQRESQMSLNDYIIVLTVAREMEVPVTYLYVLRVLLEKDSIKTGDEAIEHYDIVGYDQKTRNAIIETLPFLIECLKLIYKREQWNQILYVITQFIEEGPTLSGDFLRVPFDLKWIVK